MKNELKPFFCFYGGKYRVAKKLYPPPQYNTIVEPFAGGAGYSVRYSQHNIILYDLDPILAGVWDYLIRISSQEILSLPAKVDHVDNFNIPQEAKWLIGFWLKKATAYPGKTPSTWQNSRVRPNSHWGTAIRARLAYQVEKIRHWKIFNKSYEEAEDIEATWFIDPPYMGKCGKYYRKKITDYNKLGEWCKQRKGQVIVCERGGANWLPFESIGEIKSMEGKFGKHKSPEAVWIK